MAEPLSDDLRRALEGTIRKARDAAERGARAALEALAVDRPEPFPHLGPSERQLRVRLRAHARQLGDARNGGNGDHAVDRLVAQTAYEHWHRMLFARFLAENGLLMHPDGVAVTLEECDELAAEAEKGDGWDLASRFASRMLPQIFRPEAPELQVKLAPEHRRALESLVAGLDPALFRAGDSLGWVYQYWQAKRKEEINASEVKIGADELPAVTQLFTEPYMVQFLLHNTLGAWWAGKVLAARPELAETADDEDELRKACALQDYEWTYLRFVRDDVDAASSRVLERSRTRQDAASTTTTTTRAWRPAAGVFEGWPGRAAEITMLDPCCGSGHFLVEGLQILARLRMAEEGLPAAEAVDAALRDNIHGLEIDERCTQIAAFALALAAWTFPGAGGFRTLPALHVACSGLALASKKEEWLALADEAAPVDAASSVPVDAASSRVLDPPRTRQDAASTTRLTSSRPRADLAALYDLFKDAPTLGSLIDPRGMFGEMFQADFAALQSLLRLAMEGERQSEEAVERAVTAQGMAEAAELLAARFSVVATNVPFLSRSKQQDTLREFCENHHTLAKAELATCMLERCLAFAGSKGTVALVTPHNWQFLGTYRKLRERLLGEHTWRMVVHLGPAAFRDMNWWAAKTALSVVSKPLPGEGDAIHGITAGESRTVEEKITALRGDQIRSAKQSSQLKNPNTTISLEALDQKGLVVEYAESVKGLTTGDAPRFVRYLTEFGRERAGWEFFQTTPPRTMDFAGMSQRFLWDDGQGAMQSVPGARTYARGAWGTHGVLLSQMGNLPATRYLGMAYDNNCAVIKPKEPELLPAFWAFCSSAEFNHLVRRVDQKVSATNASFERIRFDVSRWSQEATQRFPHGLPAPYSPDPTQWLFHGHPADSTEPLQVVAARLLGYRWPPELDAAMDLSDEARAWVAKAASLLPFADRDGIVCIPSVRGEEPGAARLHNLLAAAFGEDWSPSKLDELLDQVGYRGKGLERWLRDGFFEQHCKLFHHRPFVWQLWDGTSDGFSALVNYHHLDRALLETLIYSYLGDWVKRQEDAVRDRGPGAEERLAAARALQQRLVLILDGEAPYDVFVRWKPLEEQPVGWDPDLDDGVRFNIRPFMTVPDIARKGAGVLRWKPNIHWEKDRGSDPEGMPWYHLGPTHGGKPGDRVNAHHLSLDEKRRARAQREANR